MEAPAVAAAVAAAADAPSETTTAGSSSDGAALIPPLPRVSFEAERDHFNAVLLAFRQYDRVMQSEIARRERHAAMLPERYQRLLPPGIAPTKMAALRAAVAANQAFLDDIASAQEESGFGASFHTHSESEPCAAARPSPHDAVNRSHASKVRSTLHQCARDWSSEGAAERDACYRPLLDELKRVLPVTPANVNAQRVCIPGCGTGRLVFDAAAAGYDAQGNEFAFFMLFASHFMLNCSSSAGQHVIHPWIHDASHTMRWEDAARPLRIPDVSPTSLMETNPGAQLSMTAGDFVDTYRTSSHAGAWDAVVTCFFLDTAPVAMEYMEVIHHMLRPGGVWINLGPLMYHWQSGEAEPGEELDARYGRSVELTYQELRYAIAAMGFKFLREASVKTPYASNPLSLMRTLFTALLFTVRKEPL